LPERVAWIDGQPWWVCPWVGGRDLSEWIANFDGEIPQAAWDDVVRRIVHAVTALHEAGLGHGRLRPSNVRISADGSVTLVGVRGGEIDRDLEDLTDLLLELSGDVEARQRAVRPIIDRWPQPRALSAASTEADRDGAVWPHQWAGRTIDAAPPRLPKVQVASIGSVMLILGLLSGGFWAHRTQPESTLADAWRSFELRCDDSETSPPIDVRTGVCRVTAHLVDGTIVQSALDAPSRGRYVCRVTHGALRCDEP
jgi:hypothetical protein